MNKLVAALPFLGCVIGMPLMMAVVMRGSRSKDTAPSPNETAQLRALSG